MIPLLSPRAHPVLLHQNKSRKQDGFARDDRAEQGKRVRIKGSNTGQPPRIDEKPSAKSGEVDDYK